jgi:hypothetical protein
MHGPRVEPVDFPADADLPAAANPPRLLQEIRRRIRYLHYSYRTEHAYVEWTRRFVRFHGMRHPR